MLLALAPSITRTLLLGMPLVGRLAVFARERHARIDQALELSHAYRGTAFLLGDVVEADDAYTGSHSRHVVDLVLDVAERLGLDARERRHAEFTALLHDVGKIRIPAEILGKPGPLDDAEWAVMKTHTVEGERDARARRRTARRGRAARTLLSRALGRPRLPGRPRRRARSRSSLASSAVATPTAR